MVERDFTAATPNELWLEDITDHPKAAGKLYLCAVKDVYSGRIVGFSMDSRMKCSLAVAELENAVRARRRQGPWSTQVVVLGSGPAASSNHSAATNSQNPWVGSAPVRTTPRWNPSSCCCRRTSWTSSQGPLRLAITIWIERTYHRWRRHRRQGKPTPIEYEQSTEPRSQRTKTPESTKAEAVLFLVPQMRMSMDSFWWSRRRTSSTGGLRRS